MSERDHTTPDPGEGGAEAVPDGERAGPEPTVGTGSFFAIGCVILLVIAVLVLGALFFRP